MIRDALIITCLLRLENRGQKFTLLLYTLDSVPMSFEIIEQIW